MKQSVSLGVLSAVVLLVGAGPAPGQFVAFWDHVPGTNQGQTHPNTTLGNNLFGLTHSYPVLLRNITNGLSTAVTMTLSNGSLASPAYVVGDRLCQPPSPGTPLYNAFYYATNAPGTGQPTNYSYVYFGQGTNDGSIKLTNACVNYLFSGLNPQARYGFQGGAVRGGDATFENRWTRVDITGAESFRPNMTSNVLTCLQTSDLTPSQVAVNFARNHTPETGDLVAWDEIDPGPDGTFSVTCSRYAGEVPGGSSAGGPVYAITGLRLEEKLLPVVKLGFDTNHTMTIRWVPPTGVLEQSSNLLTWRASSFTNGASLNATGKWFFRVFQ